MSKTSKKYFEKNFKDAIWNDFFKKINGLKSGGDLDLVMGKLLPPEEKTMFEKRLGVFYLLKKGFGSCKISREVDITLKTISSIKRGFKPPVKRKKKADLGKKKSLIPEWVLKKNSTMPTYVGKGRWNRI